MSRNMFGRDLPPGCKLSDIPGNGPDEAAIEAMEMGFYEQKGVFTPSQQQYINELTDSMAMEIIFKAIEYGIELGIQQQQEIDAENAAYDEMNRIADEADAAEEEYRVMQADNLGK